MPLLLSTMKEMVLLAILPFSSPLPTSVFPSIIRAPDTFLPETTMCAVTSAVMPPDVILEHVPFHMPDVLSEHEQSTAAMPTQLIFFIMLKVVMIVLCLNFDGCF